MQVIPRPGSAQIELNNITHLVDAQRLLHSVCNPLGGIQSVS